MVNGCTNFISMMKLMKSNKSQFLFFSFVNDIHLLNRGHAVNSSYILECEYIKLGENHDE